MSLLNPLEGDSRPFLCSLAVITYNNPVNLMRLRANMEHFPFIIPLFLFVWWKSGTKKCNFQINFSVLCWLWSRNWICLMPHLKQKRLSLHLIYVLRQSFFAFPPLRWCAVKDILLVTAVLFISWTSMKHHVWQWPSVQVDMSCFGHLQFNCFYLGDFF